MIIQINLLMPQTPGIAYLTTDMALRLVQALAWGAARKALVVAVRDAIVFSIRVIYEGNGEMLAFLMALIETPGSQSEFRAASPFKCTICQIIMS
jgi:hypothetical protein